MPRAYPPPPVIKPVIVPFGLGEGDRRRIANTLGLSKLPPAFADAIAHAIACMKATEDGNAETTVGTTVAALKELLRRGPRDLKAVQRIADDKCGIDYETHSLLQPDAKAAAKGDCQARDRLDEKARRRLAELDDHPRVESKTEAFRHGCGILRVIFDCAASAGMERTMPNRRRFAKEILSIAEIDHADFEAHPERLDEYLLTDVSDL